MIWYIGLSTLIGLIIGVAAWNEDWDPGMCWLLGITYGLILAIGFYVQYPDILKFP